jgi:hypothetical protein
VLFQSFAGGARRPDVALALERELQAFVARSALVS